MICTKTLHELLRDFEIAVSNKIRNQLRLIGIDRHKAAAHDEAMLLMVREEILRRFEATIADVPEIHGGTLEALHDAGGNEWDGKCPGCVGFGVHTCEAAKEMERAEL